MTNMSPGKFFVFLELEQKLTFYKSLYPCIRAFFLSYSCGFTFFSVIFLFK